MGQATKKNFFVEILIDSTVYYNDLENKFIVTEPSYTFHPLKVVKFFVVVLIESVRSFVVVLVESL